jgi:uncharacterized protein (DUF1684 family)
MKKDHILLIIVSIVIGIILVYTLQNEETEEVYTQQIIKERRSILDFMLTSDESPIEEEEKDDFEGLNYFPVDMDYKIKARYSPLQENETMIIPTSTGEEEKYTRAGYAIFTLHEKEHRLLLLQAENGINDKLFLAFADETNGEETYGGGRYLNIPKPNGTVVTIDFNLAYNPYCAYNANFSCPLPPKENMINAPVKAGEKGFKKYP